MVITFRISVISLTYIFVFFDVCSTNFNVLIFYSCTSSLAVADVQAIIVCVLISSLVVCFSWTPSEWIQDVLVTSVDRNVKSLPFREKRTVGVVSVLPPHFMNKLTYQRSVANVWWNSRMLGSRIQTDCSMWEGLLEPCILSYPFPVLNVSIVSG
jgi:hypothetical protein